MRLWSLSPSYLDRQGLLAVWREGLLAQAVLRGQTRGYQHHPQLNRFREQPVPLNAIDFYLEQIALEATVRGYHFDLSKIAVAQQPPLISVSEGQVQFELAHLRAKLEQRNPLRLKQVPMDFRLAKLHPLFLLVPGPRADWEKDKSKSK